MRQTRGLFVVSIVVHSKQRLSFGEYQNEAVKVKVELQREREGEQYFEILERGTQASVIDTFGAARRSSRLASVLIAVLSLGLCMIPSFAAHF